MKNTFIVFSLLLFTYTGFTQALKPVKIDSLLSISLPANYQKKDTLNQQIYSVNGSLGYMVVIRAINDSKIKTLKKEKDLNKVFKDYINGIKKQTSGDVLNSRDTIVGTLKAKTFTLQDDNSGSRNLRNFLIIYTHDITYTIEYIYPQKRQDLIKDELKAYFSSIKLSPQLQRNDQYTAVAQSANNSKLPLYGGGAIALIIVIVIIIIRKRKGKSH